MMKNGVYLYETPFYQILHSQEYKDLYLKYEKEGKAIKPVSKRNMVCYFNITNGNRNTIYVL